MATLNNEHDVSEALEINTQKDLYLASRTGTAEELENSIRYMKYLQLRSELTEKGNDDAAKKKVKVGDTIVNVEDLLPNDSEFEEERVKCLRMLKKMGADSPFYQNLAKDFGTNSLFELASAMAEYNMQRARGDMIYSLRAGKNTVSGNSIYDEIVGKDGKGATVEERKKALEAVRSGKFDLSVTSQIRRGARA